MFFCTDVRSGINLHDTYMSPRLSIKIILFPVQRLKKVRLETFFLIFGFFSPQKLTKFSWRKKKVKKKKKIAAARLASILATRCTGNRIVFMDSPRTNSMWYIKLMSVPFEDHACKTSDTALKVKCFLNKLNVRPRACLEW